MDYEKIAIAALKCPVEEGTIFDRVEKAILAAGLTPSKYHLFCVGRALGEIEGDLSDWSGLEPTKRFPIMMKWGVRRDNPDFPQSVPWSFVAPHEAQAQKSHGQTLQRLAERGGLDPSEMVAIVIGQDWKDIETTEEAFVDARRTLLKMLEDHIEPKETS